MFSNTFDCNHSFSLFTTPLLTHTLFTSDIAISNYKYDKLKLKNTSIYDYFNNEIHINIINCLHRNKIWYY